MLILIDVQCPIFDDGGMVELLQIDIAFLQFKDIFFFESESFDCIYFLCLFELALEDACVTALA